jgi:carbon storage regulator
MLVLSRKTGEEISIGDDILIRVSTIGAGRVRIGIEAPPDVRIIRTELLPEEPAHAD